MCGVLTFGCELVFTIAHFAFVVFAVVGGFTVVAGRDCDLAQFATAATVLHIVMFAGVHVAQNRLLVFHILPPKILVCTQSFPCGFR